MGSPGSVWGTRLWQSPVTAGPASLSARHAPWGDLCGALIGPSAFLPAGGRAGDQEGSGEIPTRKGRAGGAVPGADMMPLGWLLCRGEPRSPGGVGRELVPAGCRATRCVQHERPAPIVRLVCRRVPVLLAACPLCRLGVTAVYCPVTRGSSCWAGSWFLPSARWALGTALRLESAGVGKPSPVPGRSASVLRNWAADVPLLIPGQCIPTQSRLCTPRRLLEYVLWTSGTRIVWI